jgi:tetratricopeptide (TPR) repeat protein/predicted Ser/Thr protein kinase
MSEHRPDASDSDPERSAHHAPDGAEIRRDDPDELVLENPAPEWDRFTIEGFLGEGAMGRVYRAVDRRLGRPVALKFLNSDDPQQVQRFQREARAQGQIEHDHVCRVYDVGEVDGRPYIAMQFIEGRTLDEVGAELTLEHRIQVAEQVAWAAQAAHSQGVVHRDLKPGNVMVEISDDGGVHAHVLDFGIARDARGSAMTISGQVVGTPAYMAPEQVQGDPGRVDRRVDVYAIGATLYDLVAGRAPFTGSTRMETLIKVVTDEPLPLRQLDGSVPADLEAIVARCLEKEPARRYESARALALDLRRFLDGEPVSARRVGPVYRFRKYVDRHRALAGVIGAAAVVVLFLVGALLWQGYMARRGAEAAQHFGRELERMSSMLRQAHMLPRHDVAPIEDLIRKRMREIEVTMEERGTSAFGPGSYALGIGYLALGDLDMARERLQAAWDSGHRSPELEGALGQVLGEIYLGEAEAAGRIRNADLRAARQSEIEEQILRPALQHLEADRGGGDERNLHRAALAALLVEQYDLALELARTSYERHPWMYESMRLEAETLVSRGKTLEERGQTDEARRDYSEAGVAYARALEVGRSAAALYWGEAARLIRLFNLDQSEGKLREDLFDRVLAIADAAETVSPLHARTSNLRSQAYWIRGEYELNSGQDPTKSLDEAIRFASIAGELDPGDPRTHINLATIYRFEASYLRRRGDDPRPSLERAIAACRRAIEIDPDSAVAWLNLGTANYLIAAYDISAGRDPLDSLDAAARSYDESIRVRPTFAAHNNSGLVHWQRAEHLKARGEDPRKSLEAAARCFERAVELNPTQAQVHSNRGLILLERAELEAERGGDAAPWVERSLAVLERAVDLNPSLAASHNNLGNAHKMQALALMETGQDPKPSLSRARAAYERAIELDPNLAYQYNNLGYSWALQAEYDALSDGDPYPELREARTQLLRALELDPTLAFAHHNLAVSYRTEARFLVDRGRDPVSALERGRRAARSAIAANPELWDFHMVEGELDLVAVEWALEHGGTVDYFLTEAGRHLADAQRLNSETPALLLRRARSSVLEARWLVMREADPRAAIETGMAAADKGLAVDPTDPEFLVVKGRLHVLAAQISTDETARRKEADRALEVLKSAEGLNPLLSATCSPLIAEALQLRGEYTG